MDPSCIVTNNVSIVILIYTNKCVKAMGMMYVVIVMVDIMLVS